MPFQRVRLQVERLEDRCVPTTFTVKNLNDGGPGSLRQAVQDANDNANQIVDSIIFKSTLKGTIRLTSGEIFISASLKINGPGPNRITISGNDSSGIFSINDGLPALSQVTIRQLSLTDGVDVGGGAILSTEDLTIAHARISGNRATTGFGGAIYAVAGNLTLRHSTVYNNFAAASGGQGGAIAFAGTALTVTSTSFFGNLASSGGAIQVDAGTANITDCTFSENMAGAGGAVASFAATTLLRCSFTGNHALNSTGSGGAIWQSTGSLTIGTCTVMGNASAGPAGGIMVGNSTTLIENSTIAHNSAAGGGGGIATVGGSNLTVRNSTISGNQAALAGGGIRLAFSGTLLVQNSTVAFNAAGDSGGGIFADEDVSMESTIVARNQAVSGGHDLHSVFNPGDTFTILNCLIGDTVGADIITPIGSSNQLDVDPLLGPLSFHGGPTLTHALLAGSLAINNGSNPELLTTDQRGGKFKRVKGGVADIGAYERQ